MEKEPTFRLLDRETLEFLRGRGSRTSFSDGDVILRQGEVGEAFYVIESGKVAVSVASSGNERMELGSLERGSFFGEISLLISSPVTADVVAQGPVTTIVCRRNEFYEALNHSSGLAATISRGLAGKLAVNTTDLWGLHQQRKALNSLMGHRRRTEPLIARSHSMGRVEQHIEDLRGRPVKAALLHGDAGTGKAYVASLIHGICTDDYHPFIVIDCRSFCSEEASSVLFGLSGGGKPSCGVEEEPYRSYGAVDLAEGGTLVLRHIDALSLISQELLLKRLDGGERPLRIIATTRQLPENLGKEGLLHPGLEEALFGLLLHVPDMKKRRRDILPLAEHFLQRCEGKSVYHLSPAAERKLLSLDYSHRNAAELRETVETAVRFSDGVQIDEEHLFTRRDDEDPVEFDLRRSRLARQVTRPGLLRAGRIAVLASFLAVMGLSLFSPGSRSGQVANFLIWSLWEPLLFASFFLVGRVWCTLCPLSTAAASLQRVFRLERPPPEWLKEHGAILLSAGFAGVIWAEHYFSMIENPFPSGVLLLSLFVAAGVFAVIYQRETWCRHACPLGGLGAVYSVPAVLAVKANSHICSNYCTTFDCFKATDRGAGCPVFRHPLHAADASACKLCLSCLEACPHGAARLYLRPPLMSIWNSGALGEGFVFFSFFIFIFAPVMLASRSDTWFGTHAGFTTGTLVVMGFALACRRYISVTLRGRSAVLLTRYAIALLVLAGGPLMAYQLHNIRPLTDFVLHVRSGSGLTSFVPWEISLLFLVQVSFILMAGALASFALWRVRHEAGADSAPEYGIPGRLLAILLFAYVCASILIVLP